MKTHRMRLDDFLEDSFQVIAIFCDENDYRIAFLLNKYLHLKLQKSTSIIDKKKGSEFNVFEYNDKPLYRNWFLINNYCLIEKKVKNTHDLFSLNPVFIQQKETHIKELKSAHYILKIVADEKTQFYLELIKKLQEIPQIYTAELVHLNKLKNKKLLIF
ncbi:MAG: IPExxxVDY family protein [Patescibacteria group bacterium]